MTASIAVVTRRAGLALTLNSATHRFREVRPVTGWLERAWVEQVIVLDLETADAAGGAIQALHESGVHSPVIVVATDSDGWDELLSQHPELSLVSLPIKPASLLSAVDRAVRRAESASAPASATSVASVLTEEPETSYEPVEPVFEPEAPEPVDLAPVPPPRAEPLEPASPPPASVEASPTVQPEPVEITAPAEVAARVKVPPTSEVAAASEAVAPTPVANAQPTPVTQPRHGPIESPVQPATGPRRTLQVPQPPAPAMPAPAEKPRPSPPPAAPTPAPARKAELRTTPIGLVRTLRPQVGRLSRVHEIAEVLRARCASAVSCDASAVLVPDGEVWRVAAGEHLRPLEERLQIGADHWLATEVVAANQGLVIKNTDIARTRLSGAPLASRPNLMVLPVPGVHALVILAREDASFGRKELGRLRQEIDAFGEQLQEAVDVRDLARKLLPFVDPVE